MRIILDKRTSGSYGAAVDRDDYREMAEFHDLFMNEVWDRLRPVLGRELGHLGPDDVVADLGAGTGLGTIALIDQTRAEVWALEPSSTMRAVLMHRVVSSSEASRRVSIAASSVPDGFGDVPAPVAGVLATHVLGHLGPDDRSALFAWLATALAPQGVALFTCQSADLVGDDAADELVEEVSIGRHIYRATYRGTGGNYGTTYDVLDSGGDAVRSLTVSGTWSIVTRHDVAALAEVYGMVCRQAEEGVVAVTRAPM